MVPADFSHEVMPRQKDKINNMPEKVLMFIVLVFDN